MFESKVIEQLITDMYQMIFVNFTAFGHKCRQYIETQHDQEEDIVRLMAERAAHTERQANRSRITTLYSQIQHIKQPLGQKQPQKHIPNPPLPKPKDLNQIPFMLKRPRNAYNIFVQSQSIKIKQQFPHMRAPDIVRVAAERYNSMSQDEKRPYMEKFEEAKKTFDRQREGMSGDHFAPQKKTRGRGARYDYTIK